MEEKTIFVVIVHILHISRPTLLLRCIVRRAFVHQPSERVPCVARGSSSASSTQTHESNSWQLSPCITSHQRGVTNIFQHAMNRAGVSSSQPVVDGKSYMTTRKTSRSPAQGAPWCIQDACHLPGPKPIWGTEINTVVVGNWTTLLGRRSRKVCMCTIDSKRTNELMLSCKPFTDQRVLQHACYQI